MPSTSQSYDIKPAAAPRSKSDIVRTLAENNDLSRQQIQGVMDTMAAVMAQDLGSGGPGQFTVPGLMKIVVQHKPATPARPGTNPFTGEPTTFKAKPARNVVKIRALKGLKDMV